jgi:transposase
MTIGIEQYDRQIQQLAQTEYPETQALLKVYGVGHITALSYVLTLEVSNAFSEVAMGCYLGLRPRRSRPGDRLMQVVKCAMAAWESMIETCRVNIE